MPSVSKAQRRKMAVLHDKGEISDKEWGHFKELKPGAPERKSSKKK